MWFPIIIFLTTTFSCLAAPPLVEQLGLGPPIPGPPTLAARGYILVDARNGEIIIEHNADEMLPPASLTKMLTAYIASVEIESGRANYQDSVPISIGAWKTGGSRMFLREGTNVKLVDLLRGIIIQSGNDASVAVAEFLAGSEDAFADLMNQTGRLMGMKSSHFVNSTGLPDEAHYTTARDLAILARKIVTDYPEIYDIYSEKDFTFNDIKQPNRNRLLFRDSSFDGIKTGHTKEAGYCLVASAKRENLRLISVVLGAGSENLREKETMKLMQYGFRYFKGIEIFNAGQGIPDSERRVWFGQDDKVALNPLEPIYVTLPFGREPLLKAEIDAPPFLEAPLEKNDIVGKLKVFLDDRLMAESDLAIKNDVLEAGFMKKAGDRIKRMFD